jgi:hypothetical protein
LNAKSLTMRRDCASIGTGSASAPNLTSLA